jgi:hypothetical protein
LPPTSESGRVLRVDDRLLPLQSHTCQCRAHPT